MTELVYKSHLNERFINRIIRTQAWYLAIAIAFMLGVYLTSNHDEFANYFIFFGTILIILDIIRRVFYVRIAPSLIQINENGIYIEYFKGNILICKNANWESLTIEKDYAFTRETLFMLILKTPDSQIKIYANSTSELNNIELKEIYFKLKQFKSTSH